MTDYTVEVRNKFKGLDLIDRVPDELWNEVRDTVQETGIKTIPMEKKGHLFWVLVLKGLVGLHRTVQLQLLQRYWLGHIPGFPCY